jgi:hypothetical protein
MGFGTNIHGILKEIRGKLMIFLARHIRKVGKGFLGCVVYIYIYMQYMECFLGIECGSRMCFGTNIHGFLKRFDANSMIFHVRHIRNVGKASWDVYIYIYTCNMECVLGIECGSECVSARTFMDS